MFLKLVVLILVCGSSGVGLLSVRQSRLQAVHEMAEARHRIRNLNEQAGEVRSLIVRSSTPDRVMAMLGDPAAYRHAIQHPARVDRPDALQTEVLVAEAQIEEPPAPLVIHQEETVWIDEDFKAQHAWILEDGSRVIFVEQ